MTNIIYFEVVQYHAGEDEEGLDDFIGRVAKHPTEAMADADAKARSLDDDDAYEVRAVYPDPEYHGLTEERPCGVWTGGEKEKP